jgi:hypothetical protein
MLFSEPVGYRAEHGTVVARVVAQGRDIPQ